MAGQKTSDNNDIRCPKCNKLLAKGSIESGTISLKCKCGKETTITVVAKPVQHGSHQDRLGLTKKDDSLSFTIKRIPDSQ